MTNRPERTPRGTGGALLPACPLYVATAAAGGRYLRGRLGGLRVLVMPKKEGEPGEHSDVLLIGAAPREGSEGSGR